LAPLFSAEVFGLLFSEERIWQHQEKLYDKMAFNAAMNTAIPQHIHFLSPNFGVWP